MCTKLAHCLDEKERTKDVLLEQEGSFDSLLLPNDILRGLLENGFKKPSPIQLKAIPVGRCGFDLVVKSKSGTGKTLVFSLIALENVNEQIASTQTLILAPTREIAIQILEVLKTVGKYKDGIVIHSFIGGLPITEDKEKCKNCHIAVGTPGRIKQLIKGGFFKIDNIRLFVLDEADKLMEGSFENDINEIFNFLPDKKQVITTSATYPNELESFLTNYMLSPSHINIELESPLLLGVKQFVHIVKFHPNIVQQTISKNEQLLKILELVSFTQCLIFTNYQMRAESISNMLNQKKFSSTFISAAQSQSERLNAINNFKSLKHKILLSTDLTARGVDIANVDLVINYDIPIDSMTYLHRMGRSGRYGSLGSCISLAFDGDELNLLKKLLGDIGGANLSMPVLPSLQPGLNLSKLAVASEDCITGVVSEDTCKEIDKMKSEVLSMKNSNKKKRAGKKAQNKNSEISFILEDAINEEDSLNDYIAGVVSEDTHKEKGSVQSEVIGIKKTNRKTKTKTPNEDVEMSLILEDAIKEEIELKEKLPENNLSMLQSLAKGILPEQSSSSKSEKENDSAVIKSILSSDDKKRKRHEDVQSTPLSSTDSRHLTKEKKTDNPVFIKNCALYNASKLLSNCELMPDDESLEHYLEYFKTEETEEAYKILRNCDTKDPKQILQSLEHCQVLEEIIDSKTYANRGKIIHFENLFDIVYKSALGDALSWKDIEVDFSEQETHLYKDDSISVDKDDSCNIAISEQSNIEPTASCSYDDPLKWVPVEKVKENTSEIPNYMKWVPVEKHTETRQAESAHMQNMDAVEPFENYAEHFEDCSNNLWQNGLCFDSVESFDDWFLYEWQAQVYAIRNYVQQNIYVQEMSRFQNSRNK